MFLCVKQKTAYELRIRDWSSDVCSSDLLREDRRHIQDRDVAALVASDRARINLEMAVTPAMLKLACKLKPAFVCLVPEKRAELTTDGGLDDAAPLDSVRAGCQQLAKAGMEIGSASWRERVCRSGVIWVVAEYCKKKHS